MEETKIRKLLDKYYEAETSVEEEALLKAYFNGDNVADSLRIEAVPFLFYEEQAQGEPSVPADRYEAIETAVKPIAGIRPTWTYRLLQVAALLLVAAMGFGGGIWVAGRQYNDQDHDGSRTTSLIAADLPASRRIQTVRQLASSKGSDRIVTSLVEAMNGDPNVNVRLAAAEALYQFHDEKTVRKALAESLNNQADPNMQITLIDMLVRIRSREGVRVMKQLLLADHLQPVVRTRLQAGIADLI